MPKRKNTIIVDIDDCIADFKLSFFQDLRINHGLKVVRDIYPSILYHPDLLNEFINREKFLYLKPNWNIISVVNELYNQNYDIILLTARPGWNPKCVETTKKWLEKNKVLYSKLVFESNKYNWLCRQTFFDDILFCVEDNLKHIADYLSGNLRVLSPIIPDMDYSDFILEKNFSLYQDYNFKELVTYFIKKNGEID
jgi:hypothetical protein